MMMTAKFSGLYIRCAIVASVCLVSIPATGQDRQPSDLSLPTTLPNRSTPTSDDKPTDWFPAPLETQSPDWSQQPPMVMGGDRASQLNKWRTATVIVRSNEGFGSGAFVSADGWILTNYHVVETPVQRASLTGTAASVEIIACHEQNGRVSRKKNALSADVYKVDPVRDLALLKLRSPAADLPFFGLADNVEVGEECFAIGSQGGGLAWAIRSGNIAGLYDFPADLTDVVVGARSAAASISRMKADVLVSDCSISRGDSGGPLVNSDGELIGLTFATPANLSSGALGYHIALSNISQFLSELPTQIDPIPFDVWKAGTAESAIQVPSPVDVDADGHIDAIEYLHLNHDGSHVVAISVFVDFSERGLMPGAAITDATLLAMLPRGIWALSNHGRFTWDFLYIVRADGLTVTGFRDSTKNECQIWIDADSDKLADVVWRQAASGDWNTDHSLRGTKLDPAARLSAAQIAQVRSVIQHVSGSSTP